MDDLKGPTIQIVLNIKEGLGFGFLKSPFVVSGSLNGYILETDPVVPVHAPTFDAELVWEADKRRFRSLRIQNVPVKIEVYTTSTRGKKDKIGYLLLSLLGAQPCPASKIVDIKHSWHKLLGVKSEGKCCHPQLLMSLSIEDRISTPTPRNELRIFHSNEVAYPSARHGDNMQISARPLLLTLNEYLVESKRTVSSSDLHPNLIYDEGLIQVSSGNHLFVLSIVIGTVENLDLLLPSNIANDAGCYVSYSVFTHNITTDRVDIRSTDNIRSAHFNQRSSLRIRSELNNLSRYFAECPHMVTTLHVGEKDIGICSMDLRKLVPTEDIDVFIKNFCNEDKALTIQERCFLLRYDDVPPRSESRRPYMDVEISLKYLGVKQNNVPRGMGSARSATQLRAGGVAGAEAGAGAGASAVRSAGSDTHLPATVHAAACNTARDSLTRYTNASGDAIIQTNELSELIKKMYESFTMSQQLLSTQKPTTGDMQVQCEPEPPTPTSNVNVCVEQVDREPVKLETSKSDTCVVNNERDMQKNVYLCEDRAALMQKVVEELEDWKERQQELFKCQLKRKEEYHLEQLSQAWGARRRELEARLAGGVERCRHLAADLARATDDLRLRGYRNTERQRKLIDAKKALEAHYSAKYQELREASQKMEDDMNHKIKLKDMTIEELHLKIQHLEKQVDVLKNNIKNSEKDVESRYSGLTKDQTASLIQELRCLEEKLDSAVQSKAFFKEQWGRAVRELHVAKLEARRALLQALRRERSQLPRPVETVEDNENTMTLNPAEADIKKLKDDFFVDILVNTPALDSHAVLGSTCPEGMEAYDIQSVGKSSVKDKLGELIAQRDELVRQDSPDEAVLKQLNHEIRTMLLNCGT